MSSTAKERKSVKEGKIFSGRILEEIMRGRLRLKGGSLFCQIWPCRAAPWCAVCLANPRVSSKKI